MNQRYLALITKLRHQLHAHAELSLQESETRQILMDFYENILPNLILMTGFWRRQWICLRSC